MNQTATPPPTDAPTANYSRAAAFVTIALLIVCQSFQGLISGGIGLFLPKIRADLGLTFGEAGAFSFAATGIYALMQIPSGYLVDRFGPKRLFFIGAVGTNILGATFALMSSYPLMLVNQGAAGFFRSLLFAPGLVLISSWFPPNRRATAMGLFVAGGFTSNIGLNLVGPFLEQRYGWRMPFVLFSGLGLVAAAAYYRFAREGASGGSRRAGSITEAFGLFRFRVMWIIGGIQYVRLSVAQGLPFWLPSLLVVQKGFTIAEAGGLIAFAALITVPCNFVGGYLSDRFQRPLLVIGGSLAMLAVTTVLIALVNDRAVLIGIVCLNAVFIQLYFGPLFAVPVEFLGPRRAGVSSGFSNMFANIGAFTFISVIGYLKDITGSFNAGFYGLCGCCIVGIVLTLILGVMRRNWTPPPDNG